MRATALAAMLLLLILLNPVYSQETGQTLTVFLVNPDGTPRAGAVVVVERPGFRETSSTNASGYAVFRQITQGSYELVVFIANVELMRMQLSFPETRFITLEAPISALAVKVVDLAGRAVENVFVSLNSPTGVVSVSQRTNSTGHAVFSDVPHSTVSRVGGAYSLRVLKDGVVVGRGSVEVRGARVLQEVKAGLVNVNFTVAYPDGQKADELSGELILRAANYNRTITVSRGLASIKNLPASSEVGGYNASVYMKLGTRNVAVHTSLLTLDSDSSLFLPADIGSLTVKILDPDGKPVKGVGMLVGTRGFGNFTRGVSGDDGAINVGILPFSSKTGEYIISLFRGRTRILVEPFSLDVPMAVNEISLMFQRLSINVVDYEEKPLSGAEVVITDQQTGRTANASTVNGASVLNVFAGSNDVLIIYKQKQVYKRSVEIAGESLKIKLANVNFPVNIRVLDAFGSLVEGLRVVVKVDDSTAVDDIIRGRPVTIVLETPSMVTVELFR
ncbi:MAG: hypothetical protein NZ570_03125, partial [Candidatus Caldarchaeum sp.]|nr:hypothetical protein [Candidatus Caldarchaeum sp.]